MLIVGASFGISEMQHKSKPENWKQHYRIIENETKNRNSEIAKEEPRRRMGSFWLGAPPHPNLGPSEQATGHWPLDLVKMNRKLMLMGLGLGGLEILMKRLCSPMIA